MPSFSTSLSGLNANSQALSVIANNLANLNTSAYKSESPQFRDLFYQQVGVDGAGNPIQIGVGSRISSIATQFTQGNVESTGVATDVAIQGEGFFAVRRGGFIQYTRAGNFSLDADGFLVTSDGGNVLGYTAAGGVINTNQPVAPLSIANGLIIPASATQNVTVAMNLDANAAASDTFSTSVTVYDALGASHLLTFNFTKTAANTWDYDVTIPATDVGATGTPVSLGTGTLDFDGTGQLTGPSANVAGINIAGLANGANDITFDWNLFDAAGTPVITQAAAPSAASRTLQDGLASGTLLHFNINGDGVIEGTLSNGQTLALGQLALVTFPNNQGLLRNGDGNFVATFASGAPNLGAPGTGGRGLLSGGALERSNVDIATEFAKLIQAERGYQANARAITTADEITQAALSLKSS